MDYHDEASLVEALRGQDAFIITMNVMAPPDSQKKLVTAAASANVSWILPNEFGGDPLETEMQKDVMIGSGKREVRELTEWLGKSSWIGLVCSFWYEYSTSCGEPSFGFDWNNNTATFFDDGKGGSTPQSGPRLV